MSVPLNADPDTGAVDLGSLCLFINALYIAQCTEYNIGTSHVVQHNYYIVHTTLNGYSHRLAHLAFKMRHVDLKKNVHWLRQK